MLRRLFAKGLDFSKSYVVEFNVDFEVWPPPLEALQILQAEFSGAEVCEDTECGGGCVLFKLISKLTYNLVIETQAKATELVDQYGGRCESWVYCMTKWLTICVYLEAPFRPAFIGSTPAGGGFEVIFNTQIPSSTLRLVP